MHKDESLWQLALEASVAHILDHEDYDALIEMLNASERLDPIFEGAPEGGRAAFAHSFGRAVWNATPLPGNRFRPRHRMPPRSGDRCPCGSGLKYKHCCELGPRLSPFDSAIIWAIAWSLFEEADKSAALEAGAVPSEALAEIAREELAAGHPGRARSLVEPLFDKRRKIPERTLADAVEPLSDAYRELGHHNKRRAFLEGLAEHGRGTLLTAAASELCPILADEGNWDEAWRYFDQAARATPNHPNLAVLEITLLYAQERTGEAAERAGFWQRKLDGQLDPDHPILAALERLRRNPEEGLLALTGDNVLLRVQAAISRGLERPAVAHTLVQQEELDDESGLEQNIRQHFRGMGVSGEDLDQAVSQAMDDLSRESVDPDDEPDEDADEQAWLKSPPAIAEIEARWQEIFPATKPFSTSFEPFGDEDPWDPEVCNQWQEFLEQNPPAFDSLDILDDLATALYIHPATFGGLLHDAFCDLVERGVRLLDQTLVEHGDTPPQLPWPIVANRPALRLLAHHIHMLEGQDRDDEMLQRLEQYLILNPGDNHGFRCQLMEQFLRRGDDESALKLAARFPNDMLIETGLGHALALYRLGRPDEAATQLEKIHRFNPHVLKMLAESRVKKPKIDGPGIRPGGPDQAWLSREAMRPVWQATPGAIEWLRERARSLDPGA